MLIQPLMALDYGSHRTGVAISDELAFFAHPRSALNGSGKKLLSQIEELISSENISEVVVGLPLTLAGGDSEQTKLTRRWIAHLRVILDIPIIEWDERLTSIQADKILDASGHSRKNRRTGIRDSAAATIVLQAVLDSRRLKSNNPNE
jgi:putative Holliday junction resolvase